MVQITYKIDVQDLPKESHTHLNLNNNLQQIKNPEERKWDGILCILNHGTLEAGECKYGPLLNHVWVRWYWSNKQSDAPFIPILL